MGRLLARTPAAGTVKSVNPPIESKVRTTSQLQTTFDRIRARLERADAFVPSEKFHTGEEEYGSKTYVAAARREVDSFYRELVRGERRDFSRLDLTLDAPQGVEATLTIYGRGDSCGGDFELVVRDQATRAVRTTSGIMDFCQEIWYQRVNKW